MYAPKLNSNVEFSQNELLEMENASQIGLKGQKKLHKTAVLGIISLKTKNIWFLIILEIAHGSQFWSVPANFRFSGALLVIPVTIL